jgi:hypothetical protein
MIWKTVKIHLISKGLSSILPKNERKKSDFTTMILQVDLFSFIFWEKLKTPKNHFEINWPLMGVTLHWISWIHTLSWIPRIRNRIDPLCFHRKNQTGNGHYPTLNRHRTHIWFFIMDISIKSLLPHSKISCTGFTHFPHNSANFSHERSFAFFKRSVCVRILNHCGLN